jgi:chromosome segregation ATPase
MDTVTAVKTRVADLATHLEASRKVITRLQRERQDLLRQVEDARSEVLATREELLEARRRREDFHDERDALIRQLDADRKQLLRRLQAATAQLGLNEQGVETLTSQLQYAQEKRDAALYELSEATTALTDIRDQLRISLSEVTAARPEVDYESA